MKKPNKRKKTGESKEKPPTPLRGEELYLAQQKKWANAMTMRRNHGEGK
jgi:hypothetical protein